MHNRSLHRMHFKHYHGYGNGYQLFCSLCMHIMSQDIQSDADEFFKYCIIFKLCTRSG